MKILQVLDKFADKTLAGRGEKWTVPRKKIFDTLSAQTKPVTAYQLLEIVNRKNSKAMKPPTIYRALAFLQEMGLAVRIDGLNAYQICRDHKHHDHQHVFFVCDTCGDTDEYCNTSFMQSLMKTAQNKGFKATRQIVELHGACRACQ